MFADEMQAARVIKHSFTTTFWLAVQDLFRSSFKLPFALISPLVLLPFTSFYVSYDEIRLDIKH